MSDPQPQRQDSLETQSGPKRLAQKQRVSATEAAPNRQEFEDAPSLSQYLKDCNLVLEAAKRAQVAILTRDMESVIL